MAYENDPDPNRITDPERPGRRFQYQAGDGFGWVPVILAVAAVVLLMMLLLPTRNAEGPRITENAPRTERPTTPTTPSSPPPANKPAPTPPAQ